MEATVSWNAYIQMKNSNSSVADMMGSARAQHVAKNVYYMKTSQRDTHSPSTGRKENADTADSVKLIRQY